MIFKEFMVSGGAETFDQSAQALKCESENQAYKTVSGDFDVNFAEKTFFEDKIKNFFLSKPLEF